ncbi:MAG: nitrate reductase associated protein [Microcoleaceae cyanobacterium]
MHHFRFESDFVESWRCIPMSVRYKLDTCGIKLKLDHWNHMSYSERERLVQQPISTSKDVQAYRELLHSLVEQQKTDVPLKDLPIDPNPAWEVETVLPETVQQKAEELDVSITLSQWQKLTPLQRFALIKLSRPSHENSNFLPALKEFGIL